MSPEIIKTDVVVIGAGGAGMMCAIEAAKRFRRVLVIDHSEKIGRKILISGGGRCNFTNLHAKPENYHSANPHFCKSALARYQPNDFISLVRAHKIRFHEKKLGQLFCDESAEQIVDLLVTECRKAKVSFRLGSKVKRIRQESADEESRFVVQCEHADIHTYSVVVATGGLSIPKIGATGFGYEIAKQFGLKLEDTYPALVGFDLKPQDKQSFGELTGVSFDSTVKCRKHSFRENTLFTHTGVSGPAILQASLYWHPGDALQIDTCPDVDVRAFLAELQAQKSKKELRNALQELLPARLADKLCELFQSSRPINSLADKTLDDFCRKLHAWSLVPAANFGYQKAEVTRGGVSTDELSAKTMESKKVPGLYFVGEVVDVTGQLGGYNFQWAWASGFSAGQVV